MTTPRNLVICCDGTGMEPRARANTNVHEVARLSQRQPGQIVYYDPGLGTDSDPAAQTLVAKFGSKLMGLMFGAGLRKKVGDAYTFLMNTYAPGDRIYMFGFSRGAYTVRAIGGMLRAVGLMNPGCHNLLPYALKLYMQQSDGRDWEAEAGWKETFCRQVPAPGGHGENGVTYTIPVEFMGVWETVKSVGLTRHSLILPYTEALPNISHSRHAVALDERRSKFRPSLWTATGSEEGEVRTAWFSGVHTDVGGGYAEDERGLADASLLWMLEGAETAGLRFDRHKLEGRIANHHKFAMLTAARSWAQGGAGEDLASETAAWRQKVLDAKSWTQELDGAFIAGSPHAAKAGPSGSAALNAIGVDLQQASALRLNRPHDSLLPFWWILGFLRRKLPARCWVHASVKARIDAGPAAIDSQLEPLRRVDARTPVWRDGPLVVVWRLAPSGSGDVLVQRLTDAEAGQLGAAPLPADPEAALLALRQAGLRTWQAALADLFVQDPTLAERDKAGQTSRELMAQAVQAIEAIPPRIKGEGGATALLARFLRKRTLSGPQKSALIATSPQLMEALAECAAPRPAPNGSAGRP